MMGRPAAIVLVCSLLGCTGVISDPNREVGGAAATRSGPGAAGVDATYVPGQSAPPVFSCNQAAQPEELPLPRLSRTQLQNTLRFAIQLALPNEADAVWAKVTTEFDRYPADLITPAPGDLRGGYARIDQSIQQTQIDAMYSIASEIGQELTSSSARMSALLGACATDSSSTNDQACLEGFIGKWGSRVMRAPLGADDVAYYAGDALTAPVSPGAVADVITAILNAPQTLYRVEHGTADAMAMSPLSAFEVAARLSYHYLQGPPDDQLWTAAQNGSLLTPDGYIAQLDRIVGSTQAESVIDEFVAQWLRLDELPPLDALNADPKFKAFAGMQLPPATAHDAMVNDVLASMWNTVSTGGTVSDFLNDRHSYATDDYVSGIYQTAKWAGHGSAPLFASSRRSGLLTRAAMLSTGTAGTRPIHKGYLVRNALLCQQVGAPPANVNTTPPAAGNNLTTRQTVSSLTSTGVCAGCHLKTINPPGFLTEAFDGLGRERTEEKVFDAQGNLLASLPVDTSSVPAVQPGDARTMSDAVELSGAIDESRLYHSCIARHYFRFAMSRVESEDQDGCLLADLETAARSGKPLIEVLKVVAQASTFKTKRFQ